MGRTSIINNDGWKLVEVDRKTDQFQLYDLKHDIEERSDRAKDYPEKAALMKATLLNELGSPRPDF